ncbi:MAG: hypothetical protein WCJ29_03635 [bacterium]
MNLPNPHQAHEPHTPEAEKPAAHEPSSPHRVPIVPTNPSLTEESDSSWLWNIASVLSLIAIVVIVAFGGWYYFKNKKQAVTSVTGTTQTEVPNVIVALDAPASVMVNEESRVSITLQNTASERRSVAVGIIADGVFEDSGSRRIIELQNKGDETLSIPFIAKSRGSFVLRVGIYNEEEKLIATATRSVSVVTPALNVTMDIGDNGNFKVPKSGRVYTTIHYDTLNSPNIIKSASVRVNSFPDKTVTLKNILPGRTGNFRVWTTVAPNFRGKTVLLSELGLKARTTWTDVSGIEHATRTEPEPDVVHVTAFPRLYDSTGKKISAGPLPQKPGVTSTFWVNLSVNRNLRDAKGAIIKAALAPGVEFTGKTWVNNKDKLSYNKETRAFEWYARPLKKTDKNEPLMGFEVKFTPAEGSVGTLPTLLSSMTARVDRPVARKNDPAIEFGPVVADFRFDKFAASESVVRP